jgi:hypothetical protein
VDGSESEKHPFVVFFILSARPITDEKSCESSSSSGRFRGSRLATIQTGSGAFEMKFHFYRARDEMAC